MFICVWIMHNSICSIIRTRSFFSLLKFQLVFICVWNSKVNIYWEEDKVAGQCDHNLNFTQPLSATPLTEIQRVLTNPCCHLKACILQLLNCLASQRMLLCFSDAAWRYCCCIFMPASPSSCISCGNDSKKLKKESTKILASHHGYTSSKYIIHSEK